MPEKEFKVNILGTEYTVYLKTGDECPKLDAINAGGYAEPFSKELYVRDVPREKEDPRNVTNIEESIKGIIRHEMIHAFLHESGLAVNSEWAQNEELVDWIALQAPKLFKAFKEAGAL